MLRYSIRLLIILTIGTFSFAVAAGQATGGVPSLFPKPDDKNDGPNSVQEMLKKLEIEKDKKDFEQMQSRGKQALELSTELDKTVEAGNQLTEKDKAKLATLEKLVRKIRSDLGASDTDADDEEKAVAKDKPLSFAAGFKSLQSATVKLVGELEKTSRFTVSVTAIQTSNAVLRIAKFLKFWN